MFWAEILEQNDNFHQIHPSLSIQSLFQVNQHATLYACMFMYKRGVPRVKVKGHGGPKGIGDR